MERVLQWALATIAIFCVAVVSAHLIGIWATYGPIVGFFIADWVYIARWERAWKPKPEASFDAELQASIPYIWGEVEDQISKRDRWIERHAALRSALLLGIIGWPLLILLTQEGSCWGLQLMNWSNDQPPPACAEEFGYHDDQ